MATLGQQSGDSIAERLATEEEAHAAIPEKDEFKLSHEFYDVYKACRERLDASDKKPSQAELDELAAKLKAIAFFVARLRLFSPNEELEDISTADLKFLLVPYLLGEVVAATQDMMKRLECVKQAVIYWKAFASDCARLKVAHDDDIRAIERDPENKLDPASLRTEKLDRYKRTKDLDEKVAYLFSKKREVLGDEYLWGAGGSFDEDMERELVLNLITHAVATSADSIASAEKEIPMLEMMMERGGVGKGPPAKASPPREKPFILKIQDKEELMRIYKEMVFQCPFAQATMTIGEAAEIEMAQAREVQEAKADQERWSRAQETERWYDGDRYGSKDDFEDEQKTYKDRDWDDWKDEHPYGSGNRMANNG